MDIFSELEVGDKLSIEIREKDIVQNENSLLNSQLIDKDDNYIYITPPVYKGQKYLLRKNQSITIFFYRKKGVYQFECQVVNKLQTNIVVFALKPIGNIKKIQRRNYYRLPLVSPAILRKQENDKVIEITCIMQDLSGGGVRLTCKEEFKGLENVTVDLYIDEEELISVEGQVVRIIRDSENSTYELGIRFNQIDETNADRIFAIIFEKQRLMRKKGLI